MPEPVAVVRITTPKGNVFFARVEALEYARHSRQIDVRLCREDGSPVGPEERATLRVSIIIKSCDVQPVVPEPPEPPEPPQAQILTEAAIYLADQLLAGEIVVVTDDYARVVLDLDPESYRVTEDALQVIDGEERPSYRVQAVLDPRTEEWVESQVDTAVTEQEDVGPEPPRPSIGR